MYYVYVIKGKYENGDLYIGYTSDLRRRLKEHSIDIDNLVNYEAYKNEEDARKKELQLKKI